MITDWSWLLGKKHERRGVSGLAPPALVEILEQRALMSAISPLSGMLEQEVADALRNPSQSPMEMARMERAPEQQAATGNPIAGDRSGITFSFASAGDGVVTGTEPVMSFAIRHRKKATFGGVELEFLNQGVAQVQSVSLLTKDGRVLASGQVNEFGFVQLTGFTIIGKKREPLPEFGIQVTRAADAPSLVQPIDMVIREIQVRKGKRFVQLTALANAPTVSFKIGEAGPVEPPVDPPVDPVIECYMDADETPEETINQVSIDGQVTFGEFDVFAPAEHSIQINVLKVRRNEGSGEFTFLRALPNSANVNIPLSGTLIQNADGTTSLQLATPIVVPAGTNVLFRGRTASTSTTRTDVDVICAEGEGEAGVLLWTKKVIHTPAPVVDPPSDPVLVDLVDLDGAMMTNVTAGSGPGERIAGQIRISAPSFGAINLYEVPLTGDLSGATDFALFHGQPGSEEVGTFVPTTLVENSDGTRTLRLVTPFVIDAATSNQFQVRFQFTGGGAVHMTLNRVRVVGEAGVLEWVTAINWN